MSTAQDCLTELANRPSARQWFQGLFHRVHVAVTDTDEKFTVVHHGNRVEVLEGFQGDSPNFVIPVQSENLNNLAGFFADDEITAFEEYRIVKFMLRPCLEAGLSMPVLRNPAFRRVVKIETHWQEALIDPEGKEDEQLTIVNVNDQWLVVPGYHGKPQRRIVMSPAQVLDYQKRVFAANEKGSLGAWIDVGKWYLQWRDAVSVPV